MRVTGRSMTPYLIDSDLVTLEPVGPADIRLGDLVYTQQPGLPPLLHRVVGRVRGKDGGWTVLTKGDALATRDPAVQAGYVAGRVSTIVRLLPSGTCREVRLKTRYRGWLQFCLACGSRSAPRLFSSISRRLFARPDRLEGKAPRTH